jgi:WD40 repeat protein/biotin carboxyl carrier protein
MHRRLPFAILVAATILGVTVYKSPLFRKPPDAPTTEPEPVEEQTATPPASAVSPAAPVPAAPAAPVQAASAKPAPAVPTTLADNRSIIVPDCLLNVFEKQEVPALRDGVLLFIGTEVKPGEVLPAGQLIAIRTATGDKHFRRLSEGDTVAAGQLLGVLDDQLSRDDWGIRVTKVKSSRADLEAAIKTNDELRQRYDTQLKLKGAGTGITPEEEVRGAKLAWERASCDVVSKREAVALAERELSQAETVLRMHQIRSSAAGVIKKIYKRPGEAVKTYEPVFQVHNVERLRAEGMVSVEYLARLRPGMRALVEPSQPQGPQRTLSGHLQKITGLAVSNDAADPCIVSGSDDGTVRVWDAQAARERFILRPGSAVRAVACTPRGTELNLCLVGTADGKAALWDLTAQGRGPLRELEGKHLGGVTAVAFSADGKSCATAGEDREINLWDTASGALRYRFPPGHRAAITWLQFVGQGRLVSVGHDNTVRLWSLGEQSARLEGAFEHRGGNIAQLGASPDGQHLLYDQPGRLRLLALPDGAVEGTLANAASTSNFSAFAQFSPDGRLIVTAGAAPGRFQLWRPPCGSVRAAEVRQFVAGETATGTCAAFAPDSSFVAVGTEERQIHVWAVPAADEIERQWVGEVTLVERALDSNSRQVRIWAELPNPNGSLLPGTIATMVIPTDDR